VTRAPRAASPELLRSFANLSRALSLLFLKEVVRESLSAAQALLDDLLGADAERAAETDLEELAADYAQTFLHGMPPFGSHYLDPTGLLNAEATGEVASLYRAHGFVVDVTRAAAEDHLGVELEFLAYLLEQEAAAGETGRQEDRAQVRTWRLEFLDRHLLPFALLFLEAAAETARSRFYRSLCAGTRETLIDLRRLAP